MIKTGIDQIALYTPRHALRLSDLAKERNIDPAKFEVGLGQLVMSVPAPGEDIVTMAANAASKIIEDIDSQQIEMLLLATESGIDQSKSAGIFVHALLGLSPRCRILELKQACYSATAGLQLAMSYLRENPDKKVLLIASDVARYGLGSVGESSQGACAVAMLLSANPRLLAIEPEFGVVTENVMDFWRPNYMQEALVDGKYSSKLYLQMLEKTFKQYQALSGRHYDDHAYFCYHTPVPRLVEKAHQHLLKLCQKTSTTATTQQAEIALNYGRQIGNSYTASLYLSLCCLLDRCAEDLTQQRIGFYSYGSGCVAEYFSGIVQNDYRNHCLTTWHEALIASRKILSYSEYAEFYNYTYNQTGSAQDVPEFDTGLFRLSQLKDHKRIYARTELPDQHQDQSEQRSIKSVQPQGRPNCSLTTENQSAIKIAVPAKLILTGEHAVLYGSPAIAMAVNRFTTATITPTESPDILFDFADIAYQRSVSMSALKLLKERIKQKYHRFIQGEYSIRQVLRKPFELAQFALGLLAETSSMPFTPGLKIQIDSQIPIGCGMGSSAAAILAVLHAITHYLRLPFTSEALLKLAMEAENMQHGLSSGLDLRIAQSGGCLLVENNKMSPLPILHKELHLVNTGTPINTTGECVAHAKQHFSQPLIEEFTQVTHIMDQALQQSKWSQFKHAIRENHQLLTRIEVVPAKVADFIGKIEGISGAAKICGAGAISGDQAGIVLIACDEPAKLDQLASQYGYTVSSVYPELRGVHAA